MKRSNAYLTAATGTITLAAAIALTLTPDTASARIDCYTFYDWREDDFIGDDWAHTADEEFNPNVIDPEGEWYMEDEVEGAWAAHWEFNAGKTYENRDYIHSTPECGPAN